jgi:hypothetical protein
MMKQLAIEQEDIKPYLSKDDLKRLLTNKRNKIKDMVGEVKHCKSITLSVSLNGDYMISTTRKRLTPSKQDNVEHWHYSYTVKVDKDKAKKRAFLSIIIKQLIDGICDAIDRITWYVGMEALSA